MLAIRISLGRIKAGGEREREMERRTWWLKVSFPSLSAWLSSSTALVLPAWMSCATVSSKALVSWFHAGVRDNLRSPARVKLLEASTRSTIESVLNAAQIQSAFPLGRKREGKRGKCFV